MKYKLYTFYNNIIKENFIYNPDDFIKSFLNKFNDIDIYKIYIYNNYIYIRDYIKFNKIYNKYYFNEFIIKYDFNNDYSISKYLCICKEIMDNCFKIKKIYIGEFIIKK